MARRGILALLAACVPVTFGGCAAWAAGGCAACAGPCHDPWRYAYEGTKYDLNFGTTLIKRTFAEDQEPMRRAVSFCGGSYLLAVDAPLSAVLETVRFSEEWLLYTAFGSLDNEPPEPESRAPAPDAAESAEK
jgi:hypothetical protein